MPRLIFIKQFHAIFSLVGPFLEPIYHLLVVGKKITNKLLKESYCHTRLHLGFSAKLRIWQVPACKMEPRSGIIFCKNRPDRPTTQSSLRTCFFFQCCAVSPPQLFPTSAKYVRCPPSHPIVYLIKKVCAVSHPHSRCFFVVLCLCHTWLCLGF